MEIWKSIREFFWPLLEPAKKQDPQENATDKIASNSNWQIRYDFLKSYSEKENERLRTVETKSSIFITIMSVAVTILTATISSLKHITEIPTLNSLISVIALIVIIYLLRTLWFSVQALRRQTYMNVGVKDFCSLHANDNDLYRYLSLQLEKCINHNITVINRKVDSMVMAQEYFKRAIGALLLFVIFLTVFLNFNLFNTFKMNWNIDTWQWIAIAILSLAFAGIFIYLCMNRKKKY